MIYLFNKCLLSTYDMVGTGYMLESQTWFLLSWNLPTLGGDTQAKVQSQAA